jgi:hypothetical protein
MAKVDYQTLISQCMKDTIQTLSIQVSRKDNFKNL